MENQIFVHQMGKLCGGAHELSGIKAPLFPWVGGCRVLWVGGGWLDGWVVGWVRWMVVAGWVVVGWMGGTVSGGGEGGHCTGEGLDGWWGGWWCHG